ncbi:MAG: hypothetical protein RMK57_03535 [Bryobacterales bacterium]|nr:hypothetical protein [Bryobacteraceae bacterium]MDW8353580.1 hypothetical protein [Bryobacterales bacterium]
MRHPEAATLALYAGGELGRLARMRLGRHLRRCPSCRREVEEFQRARRALREMGRQLPAGLDWDRLAAEMRANIHVGLAAGACVGPEPAAARPWPWRTAATAIPVAAVLLAGWLLQRPRLEPRLRADVVVLEAAPDGIALRQGHSMLKLQHPAGEDVSYAVNAQGALRARYVDADTGYVTVNFVYAQ